MYNKHGIIIGDIHWGATPSLDRYMSELDICLFNYIDRLKQLDFLVILGDLYNSKEYISSKVFEYVLEFMQKLLDVTEKFNTSIVMIEGTKTHDSGQLKPLEYMFNNNERLKLYDTVTSDRLCGMDVLYLPEEYIIDQDEYYHKYFDGKYYDYIFGHGMVDQMYFSKKVKNPYKREMTSSPVFKVDDLLKISNRCYFGHIHTRYTFGEDDRFNYTGTPSRWAYNQEEDKGFFHVIFNTYNRCQYYESFVKNLNAPIMNTVSIDMNTNMDMKMFNETIDDIISTNLNKSDRLRLIVNIDPTLENYISMTDYIVMKVSRIKNINLVMKKTNKKGVDDKKNKNIIREEKEYLFTHLPNQNKISQFIKLKFNKSVSPETISKYINNF